MKEKEKTIITVDMIINAYASSVGASSMIIAIIINLAVILLLCGICGFDPIVVAILTVAFVAIIIAAIITYKNLKALENRNFYLVEAAISKKELRADSDSNDYILHFGDYGKNTLIFLNLTNTVKERSVTFSLLDERKKSRIFFQKNTPKSV